MRHPNLIPWFHNQLQGSWNSLWVSNCGIIPPPCWWTSTWCHSTCPPPCVASFKRVITWQPAKVQRNVDCLTMISSSTRLLQLERNHPDIGGEWSNAWALLKHHHSPGQRHQYSRRFFPSLYMLLVFLLPCCPSGLLCPEQKADHGRTCPFQSIFMSFTFARRCCHSAAASALFSKMPNCLTASKVAV